MTIKIFTWRNCMLPHCHLHVFPFIFYALRLMNKICQTLFSFSFCFLLSYLFRFPLFCCLTLSLSLSFFLIFGSTAVDTLQIPVDYWQASLYFCIHYIIQDDKANDISWLLRKHGWVCVCVCDCFIYRININASVEWQWFLNLCPYK